MYLVELSRTLQARRIRLDYDGGKLRLRGSREAVTPEIVRALQEHGPAQLRELFRPEGVRLISRPDLCRYVPKGTRVRTPKGEGVVLQVFGDRVTVHGEGAPFTEFFRPEELRLLL